MAALDIIASELLKSAREADLNYKKTRDLAERDRAIRLRKIVENLRLLTFGASDLDGLSDVTISAPANAQVLTYNSTTSQWENQTPGGGGGGGDMYKSTYDVDNTGIVDKAEALMTLGRNSTGATLYKGTVIRIQGSTGHFPNFVKAQGNNDANSAQTFGVVAADINNNSNGYVIVQGTIDTLDTRSVATHPFTDVTLVDGDILYLHPTIAGYLTNVKPSAPQHMVYVGVVTRTSPTNGTIVYRIQNGYELHELHDVAIASEVNNDLLVYESSTDLWKNKSISTIFGGTPLVSVPTLAQVTTAGNTTTNSITVGGLTTTGDVVLSGNRTIRSNGNTESIYTWGGSSYTNGSYFGVNGNNTTNNRQKGAVEFYADISNASVDSGSIAFGTHNAGSSFTWRMLIFKSGNLLLTNTGVGTTLPTDAGFKLDVNGNARVQGNLTMPNFTNIVSQNNQISFETFRTIHYASAGTLNNQYGFTFDDGGGSSTLTTGVTGRMSLASRFAPTSGTAQYTTFVISPTVNQTGGANGITRGIYVNPAITAAADFRAIETTVGNILLVTTSGDVAIGTSTLATATKLTLGGSETAISAIARGQLINTTLVAAANNDVLVGLDINPTFTNGAFTGVSNLAVRLANGSSIGNALNNRYNIYIASVETAINAPDTTGIINFQINSNTVGRFSNTGNFLIGTTTDAGYKLDVNGTARVQGAFTATLANVSTANVVYYNSSTGLFTYGAAPGGGGGGTVTSVGLSSATSGVTIGATPVTTSGTITIAIATAATAQNGLLSSTDWNTFNGKQAALSGTGFVKISGTTISYDNSTYYLASNPSGYTTNVGTVTSVGGTGTVSGLTLSGTVTSSGNLTLGGTLSVLPSNFASQTANTVLAAPNGTAGVPTFRVLVAADIPTLNQNTTGSAASLTTARTLTIGSTGKTFNGTANVSWTLAEIGAYAATNPSGYTTNTGTVTSIVAGTGLSGGTITTSGTIALANTTVTAGSYTLASITVDAQGRITAASNGSAGGTGTVTSVGLSSATSGVTIGATPVTTSGTITIAIATASGSQNGLLSSTNWTTFNNKQNAISLTTTGTSGAATFVSNTLNIPNYTLAGLGYSVPTLAQVTTAGNTTTNAITVGGLTVDTDTLVVDATNNRVGIGIAAPTDKLHIVDSNNANIFGRITATGTNASAAWVAQNDQVDNVVYRVFGSGVSGSQMGISLVRSASLLANLGGSGKFLVGTFSATDFVLGTGNTERARFVDSTGNFLIGTTTDNGNRLQVSGTIDGQAFAVNGVNGWTGTIMIMMNPPGMQNIQVDNGIITNVF
jgi:hypothetical protein